MNTLVKDPLIDMTWTDDGAVVDIPRRGARRLPSPRGVLAIFRTGDNEVYALVDSCPHKQGPLSEGIVHGRSVTCPLHGRIIDLMSGEFMGADKGDGCAVTVPLKVEDGRILVGVSRS
jgi:nitrite reductase (NADH) small subunit